MSLQTSPFSSDYSTATQKFRRLCAENSFDVTSVETACGRYSTEVAVVGQADAEKSVVVVSGTHGLEALAGAACQISILGDLIAQPPPSGVSVVLVHILNAWGCANRSRWTHEGIDLNRNFVDLEPGRLPAAVVNDDYRLLHRTIVDNHHSFAPANWSTEIVKTLTDQVGKDRVSMGLLKGQYEIPNGLSFGGTEACSDRRRLEAILSEFCSSAKHVALIDLHTGLGSSGDGLLLSMRQESPHGEILERNWYGKDLVMGNLESGSMPYKVQGDLSHSGLNCALPDSTNVGILLEFGTFPVERLLDAVLTDYQLRTLPDSMPSSIKASLYDRIEEFFYPNDSTWRRKILEKAGSVFNRTVSGIGSI